MDPETLSTALCSARLGWARQIPSSVLFLTVKVRPQRTKAGEDEKQSCGWKGSPGGDTAQRHCRACAALLLP